MDIVNIVSLGIIGFITGSVYLTGSKFKQAQAIFSSGKIQGSVQFIQPSDSTNVTIQVNLTGFKQNTPLTRHVGDLGNILADANGNVQVKFSDYYIDLFGSDSIIGKTIVIHESQDDLKTIESSGKRIACAKISDFHN